MLNVVMLSVVMLNVVMLSVVMLSVVAPKSFIALATGLSTTCKLPMILSWSGCLSSHNFFSCLIVLKTLLPLE